MEDDRVSLPGLVLLVVGVGLVAFGIIRTRGPYRRYAALREQDANIARYEAWRGGVRNDSRTGASVAMQMLRRQVQFGVALVVAGGICVVAALVVG
jgi:hypothetical protein